LPHKLIRAYHLIESLMLKIPVVSPRHTLALLA
jgi:hypothetical protein